MLFRSKDQWTIITDLPIDREIESWPSILDQALSEWCRKWSIDSNKAKTWPLTVYWIGDKKAFQQAGLLDLSVAFEDGFQRADQIFIFEQPSEYYRRHLLLHEATHWIMYRAFGGAGSPWFMEGMAECEATHAFVNGNLTLATIPSDPNQVPNWGRFKLLRNAVDAGNVPSLKAVLRYGNDRENRMERYVWSWAACVFFRNHPSYSKAFSQAAAAPLDYSMALSSRLEEILADQWEWLERDWQLFADEFDFGMAPGNQIVDTKDSVAAKSSSSQGVIELDTQRGWQFSGCHLRAGDKLTIRANGDYEVAKSVEQVWTCSPNGITYRYYRHEPMGKLLGGFLPEDGPATIRRIPIGKQGLYEAPSDGWLFFRVNEPIGQLNDNRGIIRVDWSKAN